MDEELLISLVEEHKELYDLSHPKYDDQQRRLNIWEDIAVTMKQPINDCKDRWKRIRDNYRRARKLRLTKESNAAARLRSPRYEKQLAFLIPFMNVDNDSLTTETNKTSPNDSADEGEASTDITISVPSENGAISITDTKSSSSSCVRTHYKKLKVKSSREESSSTQPHFPTYAASKNNDIGKECENDTITPFFISLAQTVLTFPPEIQVRVKCDVFKIVNDTEAEIIRLRRHPV